jgi:hypothetical protein
MKQLNSRGAVRIAQSLAVLVLGAALAACAPPRGYTESVDETAPSVTYRFSDDEGLANATRQAENYCRQYNAGARHADTRSARGGASEVTFVCDRDRTMAITDVRTPRTDRTMEYTYRDEQGLIDVSTQAERHCAAMGLTARSQAVMTGTDGTRTIVFECVRGR